MSDFRFDLGDRARDITGFEGIITGRYEYLNGCIRYTLETLRDGEVKELTTDEDRLELVAETEEKKSFLTRTGGPRSKPSR